MKKIAALIAVLLLGVSARAIELSLEENRGDRGSVGYVDMQRLFADSPDALRAKESFEDLVRQAEERVNLRKAELLKLRQELDAARVERDALAASMILSSVPSTATARVAVSTAPAAAPSAIAVSTPAAAVAVSTAPAAPPAPRRIAPVTIPPASSTPFAVAASTPAAAAAPAPRAMELSLPGMATTSVAPSAPPAAAAPPPAAIAVSTRAASPAAVAVSTPAAPSAAAAPAVSTSAAAAAASLFGAGQAAPVVQVPAGPTPAQRLLEFDAKIIAVQADIAHKESELEHEHDDADRGLLDVESRKTDQVLAHLYRAVSEVARREGVSVVIEKAAILYGQPAVDLTDKVLKYLKENPPQ